MGQIRYYDVVLIAIAASLAAGTGVGFITPLPMSVTVPVFGLLAVAIVGHALFVNGPVDEIDDLDDDIDPEEVPGGDAIATVVE